VRGCGETVGLTPREPRMRNMQNAKGLQGGCGVAAVSGANPNPIYIMIYIIIFSLSLYNITTLPRNSSEGQECQSLTRAG
jgi:hypothetical protein